MDAGLPIDGAVLLGGLLLVVGVLAADFASRVRIPSLLLFLGLGMAIADDGLSLVQFDDAQLAQNIATIALVVILFEGGLGTSPESFRTVGGPAALLASVGVAVTAAVVGLVAYAVADLDAITAALLGSVVASTDAAAVFAALRSEPLPERTQRTLQLESGLNDPLAVLLTIGVVEVWQGDPTPLDWTIFLLAQLVGGVVVGIVVGLLGRRAVEWGRSGAVASMGVLTLAIAALSYGMATLVGGSGFLAVYLTGVVIARSSRATRAVLAFHEGIAATAQAGLFLLLGILVFPSNLIDDIGLGLVVAATLVFLARPLAVAVTLAPLGFPPREMAVVSWAGLRGAVPVVLATIPTTAGHPDGSLVFDVAFVVVFVSVLLQAPTVGVLARRLGVLSYDPSSLREEIVPLDAIESDLVEVTIRAESALVGTTMRAIPPPAGATVTMVKRDGVDDFRPGPDTPLLADDVLLVLTSRECELSVLDAWAGGTS